MFHTFLIRLCDLYYDIRLWIDKKVYEMTQAVLTEPHRYDSAEDVKMRLDSTYIRYKNEVYWCRWYDGLKVRLYKSSEVADSGPIVHSSDIDLDISSIPLGFLPSSKPAVPVMARRAPLRKYKQGVAPNNVYFDVHSDGKRGGVSDRFNSDWFCAPAFVQMLRNEYPSYSDALKTVRAYLKKFPPPESPTFGMSFSRMFSLLHSKKNQGMLTIIDMNFEEVGVLNDKNELEVNGWWATPTMLETLSLLGVVLKQEV